ncbi:Z1 domain-containing protein [Kitasatospora sp. NPDC004531]
MNHPDTPTPLSRHARRALDILAEDSTADTESDDRYAQWARSLERLSAGGSPATALDSKIARLLELLEAPPSNEPSHGEPAELPAVISRTVSTAAHPLQQEVYWSRYQAVLRDHYDWTQERIASLDANTRSVMEQLADPAAEGAVGTRGLIVGYAQSGKSAHFTALAGKAIDAGYRLLIVLSGTLNVQRCTLQQAMEVGLLGSEPPEGAANRSGGPWPRVVRGTTLNDDYRGAAHAPDLWEFEKLEPGLPLNDPRNLRHTAVRLLVVKRNAVVLRKLVRDLSGSGSPLSEIPALIIDDESDRQAMPSATRPEVDMSITSRLVIQLIGLLPRAQYVSYVSTPFAPALLDPSRDQELFPRDFVVCLPRPHEYLGVQELYQQSLAQCSEALNRSHESRAEEGGTSDGLLRAMDMFVLAGGLKLYRQERSQRRYRYHTMLIEGDSRFVHQIRIVGRICRQWDAAAYGAGGSTERLKKIFEEEILGGAGAYSGGNSSPKEFEGLLPYIRAAAERIAVPSRPVTGSDFVEQWHGASEEPTHKPWRILVGGTKMPSELRPAGLTVSVVLSGRNGTVNSSVLGRCFGVRHGYRDLVRLYTLCTETWESDWLAAATQLQALGRAEEGFRTQLWELVSSSVPHPLKPVQVPALAGYHVPWRLPARRDKVFTAELVEIRSAGSWVDHLSYPARAADRAHNARAWLPVLQALRCDDADFLHSGPDAGRKFSHLQSRTAIVPHGQLLKILQQLRWRRPAAFQPHMHYLRSLQGKLDEWFVIVPQVSDDSSATVSVWGSPQIPLAWLGQADRQGREDLRDRQLHEQITIARRRDVEDLALGRFSVPRRGVLVLYPMTGVSMRGMVPDCRGSISPEQLVMGLSMLVPIDRSQQLIRCSPVDASRVEAPVVISLIGDDEGHAVPRSLRTAV